jgi:hypothetical protein
VQPCAAEFELRRHTPVALADRTREQRAGPVRVEREDEAVGRRRHAEQLAAGLDASPMRPQELHRLRVERDLPLLARLGVLLHKPGAGLGHAPLHDQRPTVEVDVLPPQRDHLATARPRHHRQPEEQAPLRVGPGRVEQRCRLRRRRRVGIAPLERGRLGQLSRVDPQLPVAHCPVEGGAEHRVQLADRVVRQRPAGVAGPGPARTQLPAPLQPGVQALQQLSIDGRRAHRSEGWCEVEPSQVVVPLAGGHLVVGDLERLRERLRDGDV